MEEPHGVGVGHIEHVAVDADPGRRMKRHAVHAAADPFQVQHRAARGAE
jgi:hypothetical protein